MPFDNANLDDTTRLLIEARGFIERGWCKETMARDAEGRAVDPRSLHAVRWCEYGAIVAAGAKWGDVSDPAFLRLKKAAGDEPAYHNNHQTSVEPVLEVLDRAIADR